MIKCPYDKLTLMIELNKVPEEVLTEENGMKLRDVMGKYFPQDAAEKKKLVAQNIGVSVIELINSPNYDTLVAEYESHAITSIRDYLMEEFKFTDAQAWGIILTAIGELE